LNTSLGLFASPPLILSTESVVVMEWKVMSTSAAASTEVYRERPPGFAIAVLMPFHSMTTTALVESISGGLAKSLSEVLNPPTSSPIHVVLRQQPCACVSRRSS